jgi:release factor glutamine methyltransferase
LVEAIVDASDPFAVIAPDALAKLDAMATRREAGEPVWRVIGEREFWGLPFRLSPATLEPRPDSETLVEAGLAALGDRRSESLSVLDLGTGTGCLLIAVLSECPNAQGLGIDVAPDAVAAARANAELNGLGSRAVFRDGDWFAGLTGTFDLVLSNPPYIPTGEIASLDRGVREYDPLRALDGGDDGLGAYRALALGLPTVLEPGGVAVLEIGAGQENDVVAIMTGAGLAHRATRHDLGGHARALTFALA